MKSVTYGQFSIRKQCKLDRKLIVHCSFVRVFYLITHRQNFSDERRVVFRLAIFFVLSVTLSILCIDGTFDFVGPILAYLRLYYLAVSSINISNNLPDITVRRRWWLQEASTLSSVVVYL